MPEDAELKLLRSILKSVAWAVGTTIQANGGLDAKPGSQAANEIANQGPFVAQSKTPVLDAHSIALMRLASATEHFTAIARLMEEPPVAAYGPASLARTALENSARAWRALDPALDVKMRIARGRTDFIVNLKEVLRALDAIDGLATAQERAENQKFRNMTTSKLSAIVADTQAIGLHVRRAKKGDPIGVEEEPIGATAAIADQLGDTGRLAYNDLSAVAHGTLFGMASRLRKVGRFPTMEGVMVAGPSLQMASLRNSIAVALLSYRMATNRRMDLYGWDKTDWIAWEKEAAMVLGRLLRGGASPPGGQS
jgi:hypothetical protein